MPYWTFREKPVFFNFQFSILNFQFSIFNSECYLTMVTAPSVHTSDKVKPDWAGGDWLSRFVNFLIQIKPLYGIMKQQARQVLIKTAEKKGVPWQKTVEELERSNLALYTMGCAGSSDRLTETPEVTYPDYYQVPFHAYDAGNLCWQAAFEAEPATYAMALRVWPQETLTWQVAQDRLRSSFHTILGSYCPRVIHHCLDVGCSVGISTRYLQRFLVDRQRESGIIPETIGLDLSPYMLAVAQCRDPQGEITWVQGLAEATGFEDGYFDLVTLQFVLHELPNAPTIAIFQEIYRILRPQGYLAITDNNPGSPVIQNLPPVLFTLMKSTEPWSDEYYTFEVENSLEAIGFRLITTQASDPRHRTIMVQKSL